MATKAMQMNGSSSGKSLQEWMTSERFKYTKRDYLAEDVAVLQPTFATTYASSAVSEY